MSTLILNALTAFSVMGPMAHILTPLSSRTSLSSPASLSKKYFTPFTLVNIAQSYDGSLFIALSSPFQSGGGAVFIVGNVIGSAPWLSRSLENSPACSTALVTSMRLPKRGLDSYQLSFSLSPATLPTTVTTGGLRFFSLDSAPMSSSLPLMVTCLGRVPHLITATGVEGAQPFSMSL